MTSVNGKARHSKASPLGSRGRIGRGLLGAILVGVFSLGAATCGGGNGEEDSAAQDTLTRRQKDSIISTLPVPGAGAVGKALEAADAAKARAEAHDTIG
jgi:hypothetical protein